MFRMFLASLLTASDKNIIDQALIDFMSMAERLKINGNTRLKPVSTHSQKQFNNCHMHS